MKAAGVGILLVLLTLTMGPIVGCGSSRKPPVCGDQAVDDCTQCPGSPYYCSKTNTCVKGCTECAGTMDCGQGVCVNPLTDDANCGGCGLDCGSNYSCCNGRCRYTRGDPDYCGSCTTSCFMSEQCIDGVCVTP